MHCIIFVISKLKQDKTLTFKALGDIRRKVGDVVSRIGDAFGYAVRRLCYCTFGSFNLCGLNFNFEFEF